MGQTSSALFPSESRPPHLGSRAEGTSARGPLTLCVVLLPGFSQLSLSSFIDPFRCANKLIGFSAFAWRTFGIGTRSVGSSSGISVEVDAYVDERRNISDRESALVLIGGDHVEDRHPPQLYAFLRRQVRRGVPIYAIGTATWLLAEAGAFRSGARCTVHWTKAAALCETYQDLVVEDALFVRAGNLTTCAGEFAAFDLAANMIEACFGSEIAGRVCEQLTADRWRSGASCQSIPPGLRHASVAGNVLRIVKLMERHTEDPLPLDDLAQKVSLSRRQVERLFEKHLGTTPHKYYLLLRLQKAKQLLETTDMAVIDIAVACGYASSSHFSKSFKDHFRVLPSRTRATAAMPGRALQSKQKVCSPSRTF